jgi:hypothetical protein
LFSEFAYVELTLINTKRAAGRAKDLLVLPELEALREVAGEDE